MSTRSRSEWLAAVLSAFIACLPATAPAQSIDDKALVCAGCHGENGVPQIPNAPVIWGQQQGYLYLEPRDLAKLGFLYLHEGSWDGKQIVPAEWVRQSTRWLVDAGWHQAGYGFKWWVLSRPGAGSYAAYAAIGYGGQYLIVVPQLDLIAVFTAWNIYDQRSFDVRAALERVLTTMKD